MRTSLFFILVLLLSACGPATETAPTLLPEPSAAPLTQPQPTATPFSPGTAPAATASLAPALDTPAPAPEGPTCTVLQDLNLRSGPGTAYRPPLRVLPANAVVTPLGFDPTGIPGGSWVYVEDPASGTKGWVSAGSQFVTCDTDLAGLPAVAVGTPAPPPLPRSAVSSTPEGSCDDEGLAYVCEVVFSDEFLLQFKILENGRELGREDGVEQVSFLVTRDGQAVYEITEVNKDYCIFGGNGPCNPWVVENYSYQWKPGGPLVQAGVYQVGIEATVNGTFLTWRADFTVTLP